MKIDRGAEAAAARTTIDVDTGNTLEEKIPVLAGVAATGEGVEQFQAGKRVGVPWLGYKVAFAIFVAMDAKTYVRLHSSLDTRSMAVMRSIAWSIGDTVFLSRGPTVMRRLHRCYAPV